MSLSLHDMISRAINEAEEATKVANYTSPEVEKVASPYESEPETVDIADGQVEKLASACEYIVDNISSVIDDRSDAEKLAELALLQEHIAKRASKPGAASLEINEEGTPGEQAEVKDKPKTVSEGDFEGEETVRPGEASTAGETNMKAAAAYQLLSQVEKEATVSGALSTGGKALWQGIKGIGSSARTGVGQLGKARAASKAGNIGSRNLQVGRAAKNLAPAAAIGATGLGGVAAGRMSKSGELNRNAVTELLSKVATGSSCVAQGCGSLVKVAGTFCGSHEEDAKVASLREFILSKVADDAVGPEPNLSGSGPGGNPDVGEYSASASEEGVPPAPAGEKGVNSTEAATNLTKRDAKSIPKTEAGAVVSEPAQSAASDSVLAKNLSNAASAGAKVASLEMAAVKEAMKKVAEAGCSCQSHGSCSYCLLKEATDGVGSCGACAGTCSCQPQTQAL